MGGKGERLLDKRRLFEEARQLDHLRQTEGGKVVDCQVIWPAQLEN